MWCIILSCLLVTGSLAAQVSLTADSTSLLIGDQVDVQLRVRLSQGGAWENREIDIPDTISAIRVLDTREVRQVEGELVKQWRIGIYDTGYVAIPSLPVVVNDAGRRDTFWTKDLPFSMSGVIDSTQTLAPIKDIYEEPWRLEDYLPFLIVVGAILLLIVVGVILYRRMKRAKGVSTASPIIIPPAHEVALDKLDTLESQQLWQKGEIKQYHSELNYIIREYLQKRFRIPALESVTGEIMQMLASLNFEDRLEADLRAMLQAEDLIKFAKAEPPVEVHAQYLELARSLVIKTRPATIPAETKTEGDDV